MADLPDLLTYVSEVKNVAELGGDFLYYEQRFRKEPWSIYRQDLFDKALRLGKITGPKTSTYKGKSFTRVPKGFCYDYHTPGKRCTKLACTYKHFCPCGRGGHTIATCRTNGQSDKRKQQASASQSKPTSSNST